MKETTVVLVGHCGPDMFMLRSAVTRVLPESSVVTVNDAETLAQHTRPGAVLLVNRVLDGRFTTAGGIDLIRELCTSDDPPVAILVSNFEDAQAEAVAAGASPGFGKRDLYDERTASILRDAIGASGNPHAPSG